MDSVGSSYEEYVQALLGRIAAVSEVRGKKDFGIDFFFQPRVALGPTIETVAELGSLQVKGGRAKLSYGGLNNRGEWRDYEITWVRSLATPLYLTRVDAQFTSVELFSIWPLWFIFWRQATNPFQVEFKTEKPGRPSSDWKEPQASPHPDGAGKGDGMRWEINLGPPFLQLTNDNLNDASFRERAVDVLRQRITTDRLMLMLFHLFVPVLTNITDWRTEPPESLGGRTWQFWDERSGANIERLCQTASPMLVNLGIHLQWQNDHAAYNLIPVLEWLDGKGWLDAFGKGLLDGLRGTKARGLGPKEGSTI